MFLHLKTKYCELLEIKTGDPIFFLNGNGENENTITRKSILGCRILGEGKIFQQEQSTGMGIVKCNKYQKIFIPKYVAKLLITKEIIPSVPKEMENPLVFEVKTCHSQ